MLSFKGRCFTYDVSADGYLRGEAGSFCAKRLQCQHSQDVPRACPAFSWSSRSLVGRPPSRGRGVGRPLGLHGPVLVCIRLVSLTCGRGEVLQPPWLPKDRNTRERELQGERHEWRSHPSCPYSLEEGRKRELAGREDCPRPMPLAKQGRGRETRRRVRA